jgi:hypothetical protein
MILVGDDPPSGALRAQLIAMTAINVRRPKTTKILKVPESVGLSLLI